MPAAPSCSWVCLASFIAEIRAASDIMRPESITVIHCDTRVTQVDVFEPDDMPDTITPIGGGGTRFRPVFEHLALRETDPACVVYLTDMECSDIGPEPDYPVLWARFCGYGEVPPFGRLIDVDLAA